MKIPDQFYYKGHLWQISIEKNLHHDDGTKCHGLCDTDARVIHIEKSLNRLQRASTLYHELFHVVKHEAHIPDNAVFSEDIEEIMAEAFADLLDTVLQVKFK